MILAHCGHELDPEVITIDWWIRNGAKTGGDYLGLLLKKSNDETLLRMNAGSFAKKLDTVQGRLLSDGFIFDYQPAPGRTKPSFTVRAELQLAA